MRTNPSPPRFGFPVLGISAVLLALQMGLMRVLAVSQGHHLAYVVLSIALLGFGAGGIAPSFFPDTLSRQERRIFPALLLLCALTIALLPHPATRLLANLEVDLLLHERAQWLRLLALGTLFLPPFFLGAAALSIAFRQAVNHAPQLYALNLLGSAFGTAGALWVMQTLHPEHLFLPLAAIALLCASLAAPRPFTQIPALLPLALLFVFPPEFPISPYKPLTQSLRLPNAEHTTAAPHPFGRVDLVSAPALRHAPDLSLHYTGTVPAPPHAFVDGDQAAILMPADLPGADIAAHTPSAFVHLTGPHDHALFLAPGGTPALWATPARRITAVEPHPILAAKTAALISDPAIHIIPGDPRLSLNTPRYPPPDLIVFPSRGQFGGPGGLQALGEDYLFTTEALHAALDQLHPEGHLAFSVWLDAPLRHAPRLIDLIATTLRQRQISNPGDHLILVRGWGSMALSVSTRPVTPETLKTTAAFCREKGFDLLWPPHDAPRMHGDPDDPLGLLIQGLLGPHPETVHTQYPFAIRAPTDDQPFFNQFLHPGDRNPDLEQLTISERAPLFLHAVLMLLLIAVLALVVLPLIPLRGEITQTPFTLLYFAGLGTGFMMLEVALIQKFTRIWGHPILAAAAIITTLLCGMGLGSFLSRRTALSQCALLRILLAISSGLFALRFLLPPLLTHLATLPSPYRQSTAILLPFLLAIPLGIPFPQALRLLGQRNPRQIPWACGIDSAFAVLCGPTAALIAFRVGFSQLLLISAAAYGLAALGLLTRRPRAAAADPTAPADP